MTRPKLGPHKNLSVTKRITTGITALLILSQYASVAFAQPAATLLDIFMRAEPSLESPIVAVLSKETTVKVIAQKGEFALIEVGSPPIKGYLKHKYLAPLTDDGKYGIDTPNKQTQKGTMLFARIPVTLHSDADLTSSHVAVLKENEPASLLEQSGPFAKVLKEDGKQKGYVRRHYLRIPTQHGISSNKTINQTATPKEKAGYTGWYAQIGGGKSYNSANASELEQSLSQVAQTISIQRHDTSAWGYHVSAGKFFTPNFAVQLSLRDFGDYDTKLTATGNPNPILSTPDPLAVAQTIQANTAGGETSIDLAALLQLNFGDFAAYGLAGAAFRLNSKETYNINGTSVTVRSDTGSEIFGIGLNYQARKDLTVGLEIVEVDFSQPIRAYNITVGHKF